MLEEYNDGHGTTLDYLQSIWVAYKPRLCAPYPHNALLASRVATPKRYILYAGKAPDVKAAKEIDLSKESHTEAVEAEKTVTVKNSIVFECELCSYRNDSEKGLKQHKRMKHRISQTDGADDHELEEPEIPVRSAEEMKKASDFIRKYVMTSTMRKHD